MNKIKKLTFLLIMFFSILFFTNSVNAGAIEDAINDHSGNHGGTEAIADHAVWADDHYFSENQLYIAGGVIGNYNGICNHGGKYNGQYHDLYMVHGVYCIDNRSDSSTSKLKYVKIVSILDLYSDGTVKVFNLRDDWYGVYNDESTTAMAKGFAYLAYNANKNDEWHASTGSNKIKIEKMVHTYRQKLMNLGVDSYLNSLGSVSADQSIADEAIREGSKKNYRARLMFLQRTDENGNTLGLNKQSTIMFGAREEDPYGSMEISKTDSDSGAGLTKVGISIKMTSGNKNGQYVGVDSNGNATYSSQKQTLEVDGNGKITIKNMILGNYEISEEYNNNYGYTETLPKVKKTGSIATGTKTQINIQNQKQTGNLKLVKQDANNKSVMKDIMFKLQVKNDDGTYSYVRINDEDQISDSTTATKFEKVTEEKATQFITNDKGTIEIKDIYTGIYKWQEVEIQDEAIKDYYEIDKDYITWQKDSEEATNGTESQEFTVDRQNNTASTLNYTTILVNNKRKYIDISGYVWEDMPWSIGKSQTSNELYQDTSDDQNDKKLENVIVRLKEGDTTVSETTTDSDGNYAFKKVEIDKLTDYYIEFEYNGMSYQSVGTIDLNKANASKSEEGDARTEFNNNFATIRKGEAANENGDKKADLKYNVEDNKSTIILGDNDKLKYGYGEAKNPTSGVYEEYLITSNTSNTYGGNLDKIKTPEQIRQDGTTELTDINLGLEEREQPDIGLAKDLYKAKVQVGNYNHIYNYADRFNNIAPNENIVDPTVKFQQKYGKSYTRALYASDIIASRDSNANASLSVNVIYEITLKNESTNLISTIKSLDEYYDSKYEFVKIGNKVNDKGEVVNESGINGRGDVNEDGEINFLDSIIISRYVAGIIQLTPEQLTKADVNLDGKVDEKDARMILEYDAELIETLDSINDSNLESTAVDVGNDYKKVSIDANMTIPAQGSIKIYVQLKVKPENIYEIIDKGVDVKLDNIVEIASYGSKDKDGNTYAGIDKDSQPGNTDVTDKTTWEDDTDRAPGLLLKLQEERKTNGTVFEDSTDNTIKPGETRQGDGKYDPSNEKGIGGITVRLVDEKGETANTYVKTGDNWETKEAITTTDKNGNYEISGFLPGNYHLEYTWGGQTNKDENGDEYIYRVQNYKSTVVDEESYKSKIENSQWYKISSDIRYSDALDDYKMRQAIDREGENVTNELQHSLKDYSDSYTDENNTTKAPKDSNIKSTMISTTPKFEVNLEYDTGATKSGEDEYELDENGNIKVDENGYVVKKDGYKNELKNIDFGIVRRPKQQISLDKYVKEAKVTLANGNVLIDAKINDDGTLENEVKYVSYMPKVDGTEGSKGQLKIEIDSELIQGATLEIIYGFKVKNISEVDYATPDYYYYGTIKDESTLVTITPKQLIDYTDNNLSISDSSNWTVIDGINNKVGMTKRKADGGKGLLENTENMRTHLNSVDRILLYTVPEDKQKALAPEVKNNTTRAEKIDESETTMEINLKATKMLANNSDETFVENNAEIIEVSKTGGSILTSTPGNYIPGNEATYESDSSTSESVVVLPPTGLNTNTIAWVILALSSLGILTTGIILIKKYVLKSN